jgi:predicted nucleic acid-binding protein
LQPFSIEIQISRFPTRTKILNFERKSARQAGLVRSRLIEKKVVFSESDWLCDLLIAGIARSEGATIVTDDADFNKMDVNLEKW